MICALTTSDLLFILVVQVLRVNYVEERRGVTEELGQRIRTVREHRILTQEETAAELEIPVRSLQDYEAGKAFPRQARRRAILAWLAQHEQVPA